MEVERTAAVDPSQEAAALPGRGGRWLSPQQVGKWQFLWPPTVDNWSSETFRCSGTAAGTKPSELSPPVSVGSAGEPFASTQGECPAQRRGNTSPPATAKQRPSIGAFCGRCLPTAPRQQAATRRWPKAPRRPMAPCRPNVRHRPTSPPWPLRQRRWLRRLTSHPLPTPLRRLTLRRRTPQGRRSGEEETSLPPSHAALCCNSSGRRHPHRGGAAVPGEDAVPPLWRRWLPRRGG